jgi:hypothetical protein
MKAKQEPGESLGAAVARQKALADRLGPLSDRELACEETIAATGEDYAPSFLTYLRLLARARRAKL